MAIIEHLIFVVKSLGVLLWFTVTFTVGTIASLIRYGDIDNGHRFGQVLSWGALRCVGMRVDVLGQERLVEHQPCVYVCNHQSNLDILTLSGIYPRKTLCIGKKEVGSIPLFGLFFKATGNILLDRSNHASAVQTMEVVAERMKSAGASVWVFPEGHRNHEPVMLPFKKGAFHLALLANVPIVPVVSSSLDRVISLAKWRAPGGIVHVRVLEPIDPAGHDAESLMKETRSRMEVVHQELFNPPAPV